MTCTRLRPFFVVGHPRSGTTMLRLMLDAHPRLAVPPESHFVIELLDLAPEPPSLEWFLEHLAASVRFQEWQIPVEAVRARIENRASGWAAFFDATFGAYAEAAGKARWGDKTPLYVRHLDSLRSIFPDLQVIHVIRDGRDVAASLQEVEWHRGSVAESARQWAHNVARGRCARSFGHACYREVRYEALVHDPEPTLRSLCGYLGEDFDPGMLSFHESAARRIPEHRQAWHRNSMRPATDASVGRFRNALAPEQRAVFEWIAGPTLADLGYPPEQPRSLRALRPLGSWYGRRAARWLRQHARA